VKERKSDVEGVRKIKEREVRKKEGERKPKKKLERRE
jgi:hypothetical protein